ncbi:MAG: flagellin [Baekduia sp.]
MALRITTNVEAMNATRHLQNTQASISKSMEKLSSGYRINRGADDAAGLGISESMRAQIRGLAQAQKNIQDGISLVQTAEGNLNQVHSMLQRMRELAVQSGNGAISQSGRDAIQTEINQLVSEIDRIGREASFNGVRLLASANTNVTFQVGANDGEIITIALISLTADLGTAAGATYWSLSGTAPISSIDAAVNRVSSLRSTFGAVQNRLENSMAVQAAYQENLTAAESRIRDVDMAEEMVKLTKNQILSQAGQAMLAQANQQPQQVLNLLRG